MDKLQWFKFSYADWRMGKIQRCSEITQARFINLCCLYWSKECVLSKEDAEIEIDEEHLNILIKKKVVSLDNGNIFISFLDEQSNTIDEKKKDKSISGVIGNLKRWHRSVYDRYMNKEITLDKAIELSNPIATPSHTDRTPIATRSQNIAEKRREEKKRKEEIKEEEEEKKVAESYFSIDDCLNRYLEDKKLCDAVCSNEKNRIILNELPNRLKAFNQHLKENGNRVKPYLDYCSHFLRWHKKVKTSTEPKRRFL